MVRRGEIVRGFAMAVVAAAAIAGGAAWMMRDPPWVTELASANPGWRIEASPHGRLALTETASQARLFMSDEDAGPYAIERVPCEALVAQQPPWFRPPPGAAQATGTAHGTGPVCIRLTGLGREVHVANYRSTLGVPEVWRDFYERLVDEYGYAYSGGGSIAVGKASASAAGSEASGAPVDAPPSDSARRYRNVLVYGITPRQEGPAGSGALSTHLHAFYADRDASTLIVAFRRLTR